MPNRMPWVTVVIMCVSTGAVANGQVLWKEPPPPTLAGWEWGPGGRDLAPLPPFHFEKENLKGTNPKIDVRDAAGRKWVVKFGGEVHSDTFASRMSYAVGYAAAPTYFVARGVIEDVSGLKRAKPFVKKDGSFHDARFKLRIPHKRTWSWVDNPFLESRELGGLKILVMLLSNWDTKDARDGAAANTGVFDRSRPDGAADWFAITDWGASMGKSGSFLQWDRWNWRGYRQQTPHFAKLLPNGSIRWRFGGKHGNDIVAGVGLDEVRWLVPYLSQITDEQLITGLASSGASQPVAAHFTRSIRDRIAQLQRIAEEK